MEIRARRKPRFLERLFQPLTRLRPPRSDRWSRLRISRWRKSPCKTVSFCSDQLPQNFRGCAKPESSGKQAERVERPEEAEGGSQPSPGQQMATSLLIDFICKDIAGARGMRRDDYGES